MVHKVDVLFTRAETLWEAGFYRRAACLLRDIATHPDTPDDTRKKAWRMIAAPQPDSEGKRQEERVRQQAVEQRRQQLRQDRQRVLEYFSRGYSTAQIQALTGRSRAFITSWHKKWANVQ